MQGPLVEFHNKHSASNAECGCKEAQIIYIHWLKEWPSLIMTNGYKAKGYPMDFTGGKPSIDESNSLAVIKCWSLKVT